MSKREMSSREAAQWLIAEARRHLVVVGAFKRSDQRWMVEFLLYFTFYDSATTARVVYLATIPHKRLAKPYRPVTVDFLNPQSQVDEVESDLRRVINDGKGGVFSVKISPFTVLVQGGDKIQYLPPSHVDVDEHLVAIREGLRGFPRSQRGVDYAVDMILGRLEALRRRNRRELDDRFRSSIFVRSSVDELDDFVNGT